MIVTGRCKICRSAEAKAISLMMKDGVTYAEIIGTFPDLKLTKQALAYHRRHFVNPLEITPVSDSEYIDNLRNLGNAFVMNALQGADLSMCQTRIVQAAANAVAYRKHLVMDKSREDSSFEAIVKKASEAKWKYQDVETV